MMTLIQRLCSPPPSRGRFFSPAFFSLLFIFLCHIATAQTTDTHKIQTSNPALARQLESRGARLIADYGSYKLYESSQLTAADLTNAALELRDSYNEISLHAARLDTRRAEVRALRQAGGNFSGRHLHLVQFAGPVQNDWRQELLDAGAQIVTYIPENTYLVYADAFALAQIQTFAAVKPHYQWEGAYLANYKIHPLARTTDSSGNPRVIGTDLFDVQLVADPNANPATLQLLDRLKLAPIKRRLEVMQYLNLVVPLNPKDLSLLAAQPDVVSILPFFPRKELDERQDQIVAGNLTGGIPNGPGYLAWLESLGFNQSQFTNFVVDVTDSGLDNGSTAPNHFGLYAGGDPANPSRVAYARVEGSLNPGGTLEGCDGHGTINAHIIAGYDDFPNFPFADSSGFHYGLGVCPFVSVGSSVIFDPNYTFPNFTNLQADAYQNGARVSNNSFGAGASQGIYDSEAQVYDLLVRNSHSPGSTEPGNHGMVIVFAAGNDGPNPQTIDSPGSAKNVISVGASENVQLFGGSDGSDISDGQADNANDLVYFTSHGPCADGRFKPDLVAPGTHISGGVFQALDDSVDFPNGLADSCFSGNGISGGPSGPFWPFNQQFYTASSGTSHSTPAVAGGAALVLQYFYNQFTNLPSPAMTKAFLMNSARYLTGLYAGDTLPSASQGMGEMNLGLAFDGTPRILRDQLPADLLTASGQSRTYLGTIPNSTNGFRVTLAWTDAPGNIVGNAYNNNLDLTVTIGGATYKGNVFNGAYSALGGSADVKNNVESVFLPPGVTGNFSVTVTGTSINSVGVPNPSNSLSQDFALVIYNANLLPVPNLIGAGYQVAAENCFPTNGAIDPGELVTVNFFLENIGTGSTSNLVATLLPNSGILLPGGAQSYGVIPADGSIISMPFTFTAGGTCGGSLTATLQIQDATGSLSNINFTLPLGQLVSFTNFSESFDAFPAPSLPGGWVTSSSGAQSRWITSTTNKDSLPNAAFAGDASGIGEADLISPPIAIVSTNAQLTFRNAYNLQSSGSATGDDGGVLEIQIGSGAFTDIITAGGSFVTGGYVRTISSSRSSGIANRRAWSGNSGGFTTTTVTLPAAVASQTIHLKWRCVTDVNTSASGGNIGWFIDTISLLDNMYVCCNDTADVAISQQASPVPVAVGSDLNFNLTVTNSGPITATNVIVSDTIPSGTFVIASPGSITNGASISWNLGDLPAGAATILTLTVAPENPGLIINTAAVSSSTFDTNSLNNTSTATSIAQDPVVLTGFATNQTVNAGADVQFEFTATGAPVISYQWYFANDPLLGQTNATLNLFDVQFTDSGAYTLVVSNLVSATNATVNLTVFAPPGISTPPANQIVNVGDNATFQVTASGATPLSYQWYFGTNLLVGETNFSLTIFDAQPAQAGNYFVVISNSITSITSAPVSLTLLVAPAIIAQTTNQIVVAGSDATFQVSASGSGSLNFQWYFGTNLLVGETNFSLTVFAAQPAQAGNYSVIVSNSVGVAISAPINLTVLVAPSIIAQTTNQTVIAGSNVTFQVNALGSDPLNFQWYFGTNLLVGETNFSLTIFSAQPSQAGNYSVIVSNSVGVAQSAPINLTVLVVPTIIAQTTNQTVIAGSNVTFQVTALGSSLSFQWYFGTNALFAQTNATLNLFTVDPSQAGNYFVIVSNPVNAATSAPINLTVLVSASITTQPTNQIIPLGSNAIFQVTAAGTSLSYQWYFAGTNIFGATDPTLSITNAQTNQCGSYYVVITNTVNVITSSVARLIVVTPPAILTSPTNLTVFVGSNAAFQATAGGILLSYQWSFSGTNISDATTNTLTLTNIQPAQSGPYTLTVTNLAGAATATAQLIATLPPLNITATNGAINISLPSQPGLTYTLLYKDNLTDPAWTPLSSIPGTGDPITLQDPSPSTTARFYRVTTN
ncbi:MAG TPA: immunoglobulin domain-containing protein [Verrucomicrobiae bacterium]|jgi:uncharacterized repeat protein (TIGR01451 family)|nr:immunoglobulin domain-containing protein [Verrucomicrobiae bacterium]